ncbi:hypothetical protein KZE55_08845 [Limosilactobacillus panis]|uniref:hypothetical protein n=1 Tax=Limosilactobacillus panis TaxID=47493 RepID=UPI001C96B7AA|nr:hypothetical protein [Limosilactobacillus panis]QZN92852.1 hypothetical protein KZE55_08845 [Limosilactobacillus panis]
MNREFKHLCQIAGVILLLVILFINARCYLDSSHFIPEARRTSQVYNTNLLSRARLYKASEHRSYPNLRKQTDLRLIAEPGMQKVFVLSKHKVIYIMHAQINAQPGRFTSQGKYGQQLFHVQGQHTVTAKNWAEFGHHYYFESPVSKDQHPVSNKWLTKPAKVANTIQLSAPDAKWAQSLPKGTTIIIR